MYTTKFNMKSIQSITDRYTGPLKVDVILVVGNVERRNTASHNNDIVA